MADKSRGRSRGFGRAGLALQQQPTTSSSSSSGETSPTSDNGNGNGEEIQGAAQRGRGGWAPLYTIPKNITVTSGSDGRVITLLANYFKVKAPEGKLVCQYHLTFEPNIESPIMRRGLLREHVDLFPTSVFDGFNIMSLTRLDNRETVVTSQRNTDNKTIEITIKYTGTIGYDSLEMLRLYNIKMRRNLVHMGHILVGRHYFAPGNRTQIQQHNLEIWEGILTAINQHDGGTLMVCDSLYKVMRKDTVYHMLRELLRRHGDSFQEFARKELIGCTVMSSYNNKLYKIDDVDFSKNPTHTFERRNGEISIIDYYREQYNIEIRDNNQPLIQCLPNARQRRSGITQPILLVPELCVMTGLSESLRDNMQLRRDMATVTRLPPKSRVQKLMQFIDRLKNNDNVRQNMAPWNIEFEGNLVQLNARVLPPEKLNTTIDYNQETGDFSKEIRGKKMPFPVQFNNWCIIVTRRDHPLVHDFGRTLRAVCEPLGVTLAAPVVKILENDTTASFMTLCRTAPTTLNIVVIIVPNNNKIRYDSIKKVFCIEKPIPSQVVVSRTLSKKQMLMSVCTKIGIQMAVKIGAEPWMLTIPPKALMVVGYDTYHDNIKKGQSVGGFVCSLNANLTRFYSRTSYHSNREEMSINFATNFAFGLKKYYEKNGTVPERVIIYRDGVSEGQIQHVYCTELKKIKDEIVKIQRMRGDSVIKLTFIIVTKRVNARFFLRVQNPDLYSNPTPGTVVDTVVTRRERYDFYLVSQSVRQGTVSPTMYNIIEDESNWSANHHQKLTYKLCHLYFNWMGTISVPSPCQYAHKLAYLTGTSLHQEAHVNHSESLYYL